MNSTILVKIILPSSVILEQNASMVNIPGKKGMFGVLPNHVKLTANIDIGVIKLFLEKSKSYYFVYGGIAQITGSELNIVTEFAVDLDKISKANISDKITNLQNELSSLEKNTPDANIIIDELTKYQKLLPYVKS